METVILKAFMDMVKSPVALTSLVLCITVGFLVWKISGFYFKRFVKTEDAVTEVKTKTSEAFERQKADTTSAMNEAKTELHNTVANLKAETRETFVDFKNILNEIKKTQDSFSLLIGNLHKDVATHATTISKYNDSANCVGHANSMEKLFEKIERLQIAMVANKTEAANILSQTKSPRQLSPVGMRFYEVSGCKKMFEANKAFFVGIIEKRDPQTALDVETMAFETLLNATNEAFFKEIKHYLYNNPVFEDTNIGIQDACFVISLVLRNEYLNLHPNIEKNE